MISDEQVARIRRLFHAEHWKIGTIVAELGLHPDTVHRALETDRFRSQPRLRDRLINPYLEFLRETLQQYPRLRATRLFFRTKAERRRRAQPMVIGMSSSKIRRTAKPCSNKGARPWARPPSGRLAVLVPESQAFLQAAFEHGESTSRLTLQLLRLLDDWSLPPPPSACSTARPPSLLIAAQADPYSQLDQPASVQISTFLHARRHLQSLFETRRNRHHVHTLQHAVQTCELNLTSPQPARTVCQELAAWLWMSAALCSHAS
jgi:hypothetical protein